MAEPYVNPAELPVKRRENIALGVLGALLFSAAGGLVHFGLLQLGYIAWISALVGMAAGYFGYGLFSGRKNTVHGAILAVVFTMLMIVIALIIAAALVAQLWEFVSAVWKEAIFYNES